MRIWIAGGGTGGHVYPALTVARALVAGSEGSGLVRPDLVYIGGEGGVEERLACQAGIPFVAVPAGGVHGLTPWRAAWNLAKLLRGWWAAYRLGHRERPAALFVTGGYVSVPVALAAWLLRVPILVYLPDIEPGLAVQFVARLADRIAVTVDESVAYFPPSKVVVTGYPVRAEFAGIDRVDARVKLGLRPDEAVLLVLGGSRGARGINRALTDRLEQVLELAQVVHVSGESDWTWVAERREGLVPALRARYRAYAYLNEEMGWALAAADLAISRAGASTLGELPSFGLPAVLVPYPHAWRYQRVNADWLVQRGAALRIDEEQLGEELLPALQHLLTDRPALASMAAQMKALARQAAGARLAEELRALAGP